MYTFKNCYHTENKQIAILLNLVGNAAKLSKDNRWKETNQQNLPNWGGQYYLSAYTCNTEHI